jgi:hypothetical protein
MMNLWIEGFRASGESSNARFLGCYEAQNVLMAADQWVAALPERRLNYRITDGVPYYWGCRMFDNEADASKTFG